MAAAATASTWLEKRLRRLFAAHGAVVADHYVLFIAVPLLVSAVCAGGAGYLKRETDIEKLLTPRHSAACRDRATLRRQFTAAPQLSPDRRLDQDLLARVIITPRPRRVGDGGGGVWQHHVMDEVFLLDQHVRQLEVDGVRFSDICLQTESGCFDNGLQLFEKSMKWTEREMKITYPFLKLNASSVTPSPRVFLGHTLGGVELDKDGVVTRVDAMQLHYFLTSTNMTRRWADAFEDDLLRRHEYVNIDVSVWTSYSMERELGENTRRIVPYMAGAGAILTTFCVLATLQADPVRAKPLVGICGLLSAFLAVVTAFGFLMYIGVPFVDVCAAAPFLAIGVGVDDMFVLVAAWRRSDEHSPVRARMAATLGEAGLAITITSLTDIVAICVGAVTNFEAVRIFCVYTSITLFIDYVYQITFFAGCMVLFGHREANHRHALTFTKVIPKSEAVGRSPLYVLCCAGGASLKYPDSRLDEKQMVMMHWFRDSLGTALTWPIAKVTVGLLWSLYAAVALWGCITLQQGVQLRTLASDHTQIARFYELETPYFTHYSFRVQVVVRAPLTDPHTAGRMDRLLSHLEHSHHFHGPAYSDSWLREFQLYMKVNKKPIVYENLFDENFDKFISLPQNAIYRGDVVKVSGEYRYFRFLVMAKDVTDTTSETQVMKQARAIAAQYPDLNATVYSPRFVFTEQYLAVLPNTIQNLAIATVSMLVIALVFIPHPLVAVYVTLSIMSICAGVVGYMSLWNVNLDTTSMIILIISIGFCVDYSAHITYAFVTSRAASRDKRMREALFGLGLPVLQGALSTVLAVTVLCNADTYIFRVFFKVMFLVSMCGAFHGLLVLPVLLSVLGPKRGGGQAKHRDVGVQTAITSISFLLHALDDNMAVMSPAAFDGNGHVKRPTCDVNGNINPATCYVNGNMRNSSRLYVALPNDNNRVDKYGIRSSKKRGKSQLNYYEDETVV